MKNILKINFLLAAALLAFASCQNQAAQQEQEARKPNIIYIMADDLGYGDIGAYGQQLFQTPHIDRLAREGILFTDHYAGTCVCAPSRAVLMTGRHMGKVKVRGNKQAEPSGQFPLPASEVTVAEAVKPAGYTTGMIGKWGLGEPGSEGDPLSQGWDYFFGYTDQILAHNHWPEFFWENGQKVPLRNQVQYLDSSAWHRGLGSLTTEKVDYAGDLFTQKALEFIERNKQQPFLLYLPYIAPHINDEAGWENWIEVPDNGRYEGMDWPDNHKAYAAIIERLDSQVGQIRAKIEELGLAENTLIIFTSDNGPLPESTKITAFFNSNGPLRGGKRDLYEGGHRIPMVAWWPGQIQPGQTTAHISGFQDFLPTACQMAGIPAPEGLDGISYLPVLTGREQPRHEFLYWEFHEQGGRQAVRKGNWKMVREQVNKGEQPWQLYDLAADLGETTDVATQHPEIVAELVALAEKARVADPAWPLLAGERKQQP